VGLVFFDTTSIYFEGQGGQSIGQYGHSKDHRSDRRQMIVGIALDVEVQPICCEMWPGNTTDVKSFIAVIERMRAKFRVREVCVVADRGFVSEATLRAMEAMEPPVHYVIGVRMRRCKEVGQMVLRDRSPWKEVTPERVRSKDPAPLKVTDLKVEVSRGWSARLISKTPQRRPLGRTGFLQADSQGGLETSRFDDILTDSSGKFHKLHSR
jgi:hypothetical protein